MSRSQRLLDLLQILRRHRHPVSGQALAAELGISLRSLYRDIATLQQQGADIEGAPGWGYVLRPGFMLPPLMFSEDEIEALVLGSRWVADRGDERLSKAARDAVGKIAAVLPATLRATLETSALLVGPGLPAGVGLASLPLIRKAIRAEHKLEITYQDGEGRETRRLVWPFGIGFFDRTSVVMAWCELREEFRHFRVDRITALAPSEQRYPRRRHDLMRQWREQEGVPAQ